VWQQWWFARQLLGPHYSTTTAVNGTCGSSAANLFTAVPTAKLFARPARSSAVQVMDVCPGIVRAETAVRTLHEGTE